MKAIFLDLETTGLDARKHVVIDIGFQIIDLSMQTKLSSYQALIRPSEEEWNRHDPISLSINGYDWETVAKGKSRTLVAEEIKNLFALFEIQRGKALYICQNPAFDRQFFMQIIDASEQEALLWPYHWLDLASMYFALEVQKLEGQGLPETFSVSKDNIAMTLGLPKESTPHLASQGVQHLVGCFEKLFNRSFV